jgi:hypothetical protein
MAQKVQIILEDDFDGGAADETVTFALDGAEYEIDLSDANAQALRDALAPWVANGRKTGKQAGHMSASDPSMLPEPILASRGPSTYEPSRKASRPSGFDPSRKSCRAPRRGHSEKGLASGDRYHCPVPGCRY